MQIYLSEGLCKKLCIKIILRNYKFPKKIKLRRKNIFQERKHTCRPAVGNHSPGGSLVRPAAPLPLLDACDHRTRKRMDTDSQNGKHLSCRKAFVTSLPSAR